MTFRPKQMVMSRPLCISFLISCVIGLSSCSGPEASCDVDADCFVGESCVDGTCSVGGGDETPDGGGVETGTSDDSGSSSNNLDDGGSTPSHDTSDDSADTEMQDSSAMDGGDDASIAEPACVIDRFGNTCTDDDYEPNGGTTPGGGPDQYALPFESDTWCDADGVLTSSRTFDATLCAGDDADAFRFMIQNNSPACITSEFVTVRYTVEFDTPCDPELVVIEPYTFGRDPGRNDLCEDDEDVRCAWDDGKFVIDWVVNVDQYIDVRLLVAPVRDDVQLDYHVTIDIIQ